MNSIVLNFCHLFNISCLSFLSFHKQRFCTHVPIRQGSATTGQSEPRDNKDGEGPVSEITGHVGNEHQDPESAMWNVKSF